AKTEYYSNPKEMLIQNKKSQQIYNLKKRSRSEIVVFIKKSSYALVEERLDLRESNKELFLSGIGNFSHDLKMNLNDYSINHRKRIFLDSQLVVNFNLSRDGMNTYIHEMGHIFGLTHGHEDDGIFYFAKGFAKRNSLSSIMCYSKITNSIETPVFSGPNVYVNGIRMGDDNHNSVRAIKIIAPRLKALTYSIL
ncbi:MAG TPA: hypothetical protein EYG89_04875, partial [Bacteroidia bacterium]|nr:hypothetical protein [Bacteroidia bacterium]